MNTNLNVQEIYDALLEQRKRLQDFFDSVPDERKYSNAVLFTGTIGSLSDECRKCKRSIMALDECIKKFKDYWRKRII